MLKIIHTHTLTTDSTEGNKIMPRIVRKAPFDQPHLPTEIELVSAPALLRLGDRVQHRAVLDSDETRPSRGVDPAHKVHGRHIRYPGMCSVVQHNRVPAVVFVLEIGGIRLAQEAQVLDPDIGDHGELVDERKDLGRRVLGIQAHDQGDVEHKDAQGRVDIDDGSLEPESERLGTPLDRVVVVRSWRKPVHANVVDPLLGSWTLDLFSDMRKETG